MLHTQDVGAAPATREVKVEQLPPPKNADGSMTISNTNEASETQRDSQPKADSVEKIATDWISQNGNCDFTEQIAKKIRRKTAGADWIPGGLRTAFRGRAKETATWYKDESIRSLLFKVWQEQVDSKKPAVQVDVTGSTLRRDFDIKRALDSEQTSYLYSVDCSGYVALAAKAGLKGGKLKAAAEAAASKNSSRHLIYAQLYSPLAAAIEENQAIMSLTDLEKLDALWGLTAASQKLASEDTITTFKLLRALATLQSSQSSANAGVELSAGADAGAFAVDASAGGRLSRSVSLNKVDTYLLEGQTTISVTVRELRERTATAVSKAKVVNEARIEGNEIVFSVEWPAKVCSEQQWENASIGGSPKMALGGGVCKVAVPRADGVTGTAVSLKSSALGLSIQFTTGRN